jgi:hypothetical protein
MKLAHQICALAALITITGTALLQADTLKITPRSSWNALEPKPYRQHTPTRFTIHHTAVAFDRDRDAGTHIRNIQVWGMGEARNWADIPYHFLIAPTGEIFEGRDPMTEGESATPYDTSGHLQLNLLGNFAEQEPTLEQLKSLVQLMAWAHHKFSIPVETIAAHRDFAATACPGENLYRFVENGALKEETAKLIRQQGRQQGEPRTPSSGETTRPRPPHSRSSR